MFFLYFFSTATYIFFVGLKLVSALGFGCCCFKKRMIGVFGLIILAFEYEVGFAT